MPNQLNMPKTQILGDLFAAAGLLNVYFYPDNVPTYQIQRQRIGAAGAESHFKPSPAHNRTLSRFPHISAQPVV